MNRSKDRYMVAQCSSCRKYRGDIPIGGVILLPMILGGDIYQTGGATPRRVQAREHPQDENGPFPLMSKGEI
jgi:hypothetical protein